MSASYELINYELRPAKNIERKMIADVIRRLREFAPLSMYQYVGFGSTFFSDFALFHRTLGFQTMVSIEKDVHNQARFDFNRPFACIAMEYGHSTDVLPRIAWDSETVVWLDYDGKLDRSVLADVEFVCIEAKPGSALIVTVNAHPDPVGERLEALARDVGLENVPDDVTRVADLGGWKTAVVYRRIINNIIAQTLRDRSAAGGDGAEFVYQQLFNFHYQDGSPMLTVGGLLHLKDQRELVEKCAFDDFDYVCRGVEPYRIEVPSLTFREMRHLNAQFPDGAPFDAPGVPAGDVENYARVYRYFPAFVDAEVS